MSLSTSVTSVRRLASAGLMPALALPLLAADSEFTRGKSAPPVPAAEWSAPDGQRFAFDGAFYSFANADGQGIKLWVPPGEAPIRGVILFGNPGGGLGGDTRNKTRQRDVVEFAARYRFGVAGVTGFPGRDTYEKLGRHVLAAFREWGRHGVHPELEHVPFIFTGSSNAGVFAFAMMMLAPERTIGITPNVGPMYHGRIDDAVRKVPVWLHVGTCDPFFMGGVQDTEALFAEHGPRGARWTWEAEIKGHENGSSDHVDLAFWDAIIPLRLPAAAPDAGMRTSPVALRDLDPATGWWTDFRTWDHAIASVFPASQPKPFAAEASRYGWVPTEGIARLYQSAASRTRVMALSFVENRAVAGGAATGELLSSRGSQLVSPGDRVTIQVKLAALQRPLETIEFFDRAEKLGEIKGRETLAFTFTADDRPVYAICARARQGRRESDVAYERVSNPLQVVVRQPRLSAAIDAQWAAVDWVNRHKTDALDPAALDRIKGEPEAGATNDTLRAVALDPAREASLRADGAVSDFWNTPAMRADSIVIDKVSELARRDGDVRVLVSAAYGEAGLYLLFRIRDASRPAAGDASAGRIDFHLASAGLPHVRATRGSLDTFATPALNSLLRNAVQIAFDGSPATNGAAPDISMNHWQPWDMVDTVLSAADGAYAGSGLWVDRATVDDGTLAVELFLPWAMVGNPGLRARPPAGSSFATVLGYRAASQPNTYRWPHAKDPWAVAMARDPETAVFGQIVLAAPTGRRSGE